MGASLLGMGIVSAYGIGVQPTWEGLLRGQSAVEEVWVPDGPDRSRFLARVHDVDDFVPVQAKYGSRVASFAVAAAQEAFASALAEHTDVREVSSHRVGVAVGTSGGIRTALDLTLDQSLMPALDASPLDCFNGIAQAIAETFGLSGPCASLNTACSAGAAVIELAYAWLQSRHADLVIVCGADEYTPFSALGFDMIGAYADHACAPFAISDGVNLGEGAGAIVLSRPGELAPLSVPSVLAVGLSADAYHPTAPHPEGRGLVDAISRAMRAAKADLSEIGYVNLHGTGTRLNDAAEQVMLGRLFDDASLPPVYASGTKGGTGHTLGAAGMIECVMTVCALQEQKVPPTVNAAGAPAAFTMPTGRARLVSDAPAELSAPDKLGLSVNGAFGGHNAAVLVSASSSRAARVPAFARSSITAASVVVAPESVARSDASQEHGRCATVRDELLRPVLGIERRRWRRLGRLTQMALCLVDRALKERSGQGKKALDFSHVALVVATARGPSDSYGDLHETLSAGRRFNPALFPRLAMTYCAGTISEELGLRGPNITLTAGAASVAAALSLANTLLSEADDLQGLIVVAVDTVADYLLSVEQYRGRQLRDSGAVIIIESGGDTRGTEFEMQLGRMSEHVSTPALGLGAADLLLESLERGHASVFDPWGQFAALSIAGPRPMPCVALR